MSSSIVVLHVTVCIALIMIVMLQTGKDADKGAAFGGGSNTPFDATGASTFLGKMTTVVAVVFMLTSLTLAILVNRGRDTSTMREAAPAPTTTEQAAPETPPAQPQAPATENTEPATPEATKSG